MEPTVPWPFGSGSKHHGGLAPGSRVAQPLLYSDVGMFAVLYEFHQLEAVPETTGRDRTIDQHVRRLQLEHFLVASPTEDRSRRWRRIRSRERATIVTQQGAWPTIVEDASASGFRLAGAHPLMVGDEVEVRGDGYTFPCRVVWWSANRAQVGLQLSGRPRVIFVSTPRPSS